MEPYEFFRNVDHWEGPMDGLKNPGVAANTKYIFAFPSESIPVGWEPLSAEAHPDAFPVSGLGQLPDGKFWCIEA
jgi:hypothetical protein